MPPAKPKLKAECIRLRCEEKLSIREIQEITGASKGSLSSWLKAHPLSKPEQAACRKRAFEQRKQREEPPESPAPLAVTGFEYSKAEKGLIAEAGFIFQALLHKLLVFRPFNPQLPYDFVIEAEGTQFKVQVKTAWEEGSGYKTNLIKRRRGPQGLIEYNYQQGDFDFLAVFHMLQRDFWIFPAEEVMGRASVYLRTTKARGFNGKDFDASRRWKAWHLFQNAATNVCSL